MSRRWIVAVAGAGLIALVASPAAMAQPGGSPGTAGRPVTDAGSRELSVATRLADRREVAAGTRAYSIGFEDGGFYANGWHITGEMGGVWTPPVKLVDGVWFGLDDQWIGPATSFTSGWGYTRYDLPETAGLKVSRTDCGAGRASRRPLRPDDREPGWGQDDETDRRHPLGADGPVPVGIRRCRSQCQGQPARQGQLRRAPSWCSPTTAPCRAAPRHHYAAAVGTSLRPDGGEVGDQFWGPRAGHRCTGDRAGRAGGSEAVGLRRRPVRQRHRRSS